MTIHVHQVPYDSGHRAARMGRGPVQLIEHANLLDQLRRLDPDVRLVPIEAETGFRTEIGTTFELHRKLAAKVAAAVQSGGLPLVLSGNCNSAIGTVAGLQAAWPQEPVGVVWFDGHADFDTPETSAGDFLDSMGLSTLTGRCWRALARAVPGHRPVADEHVILVGAHHATDGARTALKASRITVIVAADVVAQGAEAALDAALGRLEQRGIRCAYVHLDLDVLDSGFAAANEFAAPGGLRPEHLAAAVETVTRRLRIAAAAVTAYDPGCDRNDRILAAALALLVLIASRSDDRAG